LSAGSVRDAAWTDECSSSRQRFGYFTRVKHLIIAKVERKTTGAAYSGSRQARTWQ
jgi:hypothetical protein